MTSREYKFIHTPVLLKECVEGLNIISNGTYVDCTVGGAGHSVAILDRLDVHGKLICIDKDQEAIDTAMKILSEKESSANLMFFCNDFSRISEILQSNGINKVNGVIADFGVSSHQLDSNVRGFGYMQDGPLDMRMDLKAEITAEYVVNSYSESELERILTEYGEERYSRKIASMICRQRISKPIRTTVDLTEIIYKSIPPKARREKQHPAKRTFQAIRIEVNNELKSIKNLLSQIPSLLVSGGRFAAISFHSLEDRMVKEAIRSFEYPCTCPSSRPICSCGRKSLGRSIGRKPIIATEAEIENNPRARSAKLRVFERNGTMPV
jgi:16S rRNA (cytosine1402-N4)-methyltransferase